MGGQEPCEFSMFGVLFSKHRAKAENRMFFFVFLQNAIYQGTACALEATELIIA